VNTNHPSARDAERFPEGGLTYEESIRSYDAIIRRVAAAAGEDVVLTDVEQVFREATTGSREALERLLLADLLHLSEAGHDLYFETLRTPVLDEVRTTLARRS
jgi:hypothetical protein